MKKYTRNRMYMLSRVSAVLEKYQSDYADNPKLVESVSELEAHIVKLREMLALHDNLNIGWKEVKATKLKAFAIKYGLVRDIAINIAHKEGYAQVLPIIERSITEITIGSAAKVLSKFQSSLNAMEQLAEHFVDSPKAATLYAELKTDFADFQYQLIEPSARRKQSKALTANIAEYEKLIMTFLKRQLDGEVNLHTEKEGEFYSNYDLNRKIPKIGTTSTQTEEELNVPVEVGNDQANPPTGNGDSVSDDSEDDATI